MNQFIGATPLKELQENQLELFRSWATQGDWHSFHANHYDWWAFPIDAPSSFGFRYSLTPEAIAELAEDSQFLANLREASTLLALSWGWNLLERKPVERPEPGQVWANWPIRLYKCFRSVEIFRQIDLVNNVKHYTQFLADQGVNFEYSGRDLLQEIIS